MTSIYDSAKIKCRTFIESINALFNMGKDLETQVNGKQDALVSGTNIKTINGSSVLGEGNITVEAADIPNIEGGDAGKALVVNAGETGAEWSKDVQVNTTPAGTGSAVNAAYVNDATDGVNNIVHKTGNETVGGNKEFTGVNTFSETIYVGALPIIKKINTAYNERPANTEFMRMGIYDKNGIEVSNIVYAIRDSGLRAITLYVKAENNQVATLGVVADNKGTVENPIIERYGSLSNIRVATASQVSGNTTYDTDIVTVGMLKNLGLI